MPIRFPLRSLGIALVALNGVSPVFAASSHDAADTAVAQLRPQLASIYQREAGLHNLKYARDMEMLLLGYVAKHPDVCAIVRYSARHAPLLAGSCSAIGARPVVRYLNALHLSTGQNRAAIIAAGKLRFRVVSAAYASNRGRIGSPWVTAIAAV